MRKFKLNLMDITDFKSVMAKRSAFQYCSQLANNVSEKSKASEIRQFCYRSKIVAAKISTEELICKSNANLCSTQ